MVPPGVRSAAGFLPPAGKTEAQREADGTPRRRSADHLGRRLVRGRLVCACRPSNRRFHASDPLFEAPRRAMQRGRIRRLNSRLWRCLAACCADDRRGCCTVCSAKLDALPRSQESPKAVRQREPVRKSCPSRLARLIDEIVPVPRFAGRGPACRVRTAGSTKTEHNVWGKDGALVARRSHGGHSRRRILETVGGPSFSQVFNMSGCCPRSWSSALCR